MQRYTEDASRPGGPDRREWLVTRLAVVAVAVAGVAAAVMHQRPGLRLDDRWLGSSAPRASVAAGSCAECGVVEAVVAVNPAVRAAGPAWRVRVRMDDGSVRVVEQRDALAAGSRVLVAGGVIRSF